MKPIVINIHSLVDKVVVEGNNTTELSEIITKTLNRVIYSSLENTEEIEFNKAYKAKTHRQHLDCLKASLLKDFDDSLSEFLNALELPPCEGSSAQR